MTDSKLCTKTQSWVIIQPPLLVGNGSVTGVTCYGGNNGAASLSGAGGTPPYTYKWGIGPTAPQITGLSAGLYYATITDANLCTNVTGLTVTQPSGMTITAIPVLASCPGSSNGQITSNVSGGSGGPFNYQWNNGQSGSTAINLSSGSYTVTVTNGAGCKAISPPIYVGTANHLPDPAGIISGPAFVSPGQTGVVYTVPLIQYATGYNWNLPDGAGITDASPGSITVDFAIWATSGNLSVYGNNDCGSGATSPNLGITVVQMNLSLPTSTIGVGENNCYNATQTIYVGGGGKTFTVSSGGSATMIAGQNIVYLPGTAVTNEGYMHGFIATNGQYCIMPGNPVVNSAVKVGEVQLSVPDLIKNRHVRVYPNPMSESFTVELAGTEGAGMTRVDIYGMNGVKVLSATLIGERKHIFTAEHLLPGMYFLHITAGTTRETMKLIKM
jgi:hypothetical protein